MKRFGIPALIALFAAFCGPLAGTAAASSAPFPTITGGDPAAIGTPVTATPSQAGDSAAWEACPNGIPDGTILAQGPPDTPVTYTLALTDAGSDLCAVELGAGGDQLGYSDPIGPVDGLPAGAGPALSSASGPITAGQPLNQTQSLVVSQGAWGAAQSVTDVWKKCDPTGENCVPVFSGPSYTLTRSDVGDTIEVVETAIAGNGAHSSATTALTGAVRAVAPVSSTTSPPTVSGTPQVGATLTASPGTWSNQPTVYTYQWDRCSGGACTPISGATNATYVAGSADLGDTLVVYVTGAVYPNTTYGSTGSPALSYPTNPVVGVSSSGAPSPNPGIATVVPITSLHRSSGAVGRLTATMRWTFRYAPRYTQIAALSVEGPAVGATIATRCTGKGCPFKIRRIKVRKLKRCRTRPTGHCRAPREVRLEPEFRGHNLAVGSRVTVTISRPLDIGKYYRFVVRRRRAPSVEISCVAPGSIVPGKNCTGL